MKRRQSVQIICGLLEFTGINVTSNWYTCSQFFRVCIMFLVLMWGNVSIVVYAYVNRDDLQRSIQTVAYLEGGFLLVVTVFTFIHARRDLKIFFDFVDKNVFTYSDEANIPVHYNGLLDERNLLQLYSLALCYQCIGFTLAAISPFITYILGSHGNFLLYPGWMPWTTNNFGSFAFTYLHQSLINSFVFWAYYLTLVFMIFVTREFLRQYLRLCTALSTIDQRTRQLLVNGTGPVSNAECKSMYEDVFANQFCQCIRHHQLMIKLFQIFKSWFEILFFVELTLGLTSFAFVFYNLLLTNHFGTYLNLVASAFVIINSLFTRCLVGEIFSTMNDKIAKTIFFDVNWHQMNEKNRRLICLFHFYVQHQSLDLFAFSIFKASFGTFASIMRMTYSYCNILRPTL